MRYKVLIAGRDDKVVDDFFAQKNSEFEVMTTSTRHEDIGRHLDYFKPDVLVFNACNETRESIHRLIGVQSRLSAGRIPIVLIGRREECEAVDRSTLNLASLTLYRPVVMDNVSEKIIRLLDKLRAEKGGGENEAAAEQPRQEAGSASGVPPQEGRPAAAAVSGNPPQSPAVSGTEAGGLKPAGTAADKASQSPGAGERSAAENAASGIPARYRMPEIKLRQHILVVDDNSIMLKLIKEYLHEKYDVATAVSGRIALKFLERKSTDLILLDYEMPGENGPAVLAQLRAREATRNIPVVFLTGVMESRKIQEALRLKPQSYLLKPVDREKLLGTIEKIIG